MKINLSEGVIVGAHGVVMIALLVLRTLAAASLHQSFLIDGETRWLLVARLMLDRILPYPNLVTRHSRRGSSLKLLGTAA